MSEQMDVSEEDMETLRKMLESFAVEMKQEFKRALSSINSFEAKLEKTMDSANAMAQSLQSLATGRLGGDTANVVGRPVQVSSDTTEVITCSVGLVEPWAPVPAIGEQLGIAPLIPDDRSIVMHASCLTECQSHDSTDLAPAFTSAAAPSTPATTVDTVPVLEVVPKVQLQKLYNDSEFCKPSSNQNITSKVPLHRPLPWPSYMEIHAARDGTRSRPWPSFSETCGCQFSGKVVEKMLQCSTASASASTCDVIELQILNSYGNLCTYTVGTMVHDTCVQSASELKMSSIGFTTMTLLNVLSSGDNLVALSYKYLVVEINIAGSWVAGYLAVSAQSPTHCFIARKQQAALLYVSGMYLASSHGQFFWGVVPWSEMLGRSDSLCVQQSYTIQMRVPTIVIAHIVAQEFARVLSINSRKTSLVDWIGMSNSAYDPFPYCPGYFVTGVHMYVRETCSNQRLLLVGSVTCGPLQHVQTVEWLKSPWDPGQEGTRIYSVQAVVFDYISMGNAQVQGTIEATEAPAQWQFPKKVEFAGSGIYASENLTKRMNPTGNTSLLRLQGSAYCSHSDQYCKSNWKHGSGDFSQAEHNENLALIPLSKLELDGVASVLGFLQVQGPARYQCCAHASALVQNELKNSQVLLLPWVLEQKDFAIDFQFQMSIVIDDWCLMVRSVRLAFHVFAWTIEKCCQNWRSWQSAISLDALLFLIKSVCLTHMDYWWIYQNHKEQDYITLPHSIHCPEETRIMLEFQCCGENQTRQPLLKKELGDVSLIPCFLRGMGHIRYISSTYVLAVMMRILFEAGFTCMLPICTCITRYKSMGYGEVNQHWEFSWDPGDGVLVLCNCEEWTASELTPGHNLGWSSMVRSCAFWIWLVVWIVDDLDFSACYGQAISQEGRHALIQAKLDPGYYIAYWDKTSVSYDSYQDEAGSFDKVGSDLFHYLKEYHADTNNIREVHVPWDPGESALRQPLKTSAWGQADFQEGRNVMALAYIAQAGLVSWAHEDGLGPSNYLVIHIHSMRHRGRVSVWITNRTPLFLFLVFLSSPTSGYLLL